MTETPPFSQRFRRAAFIGETVEGRRIIVEMVDPIHLRVEQHHTISRSTLKVTSEPALATIVGILGGQYAWAGDMPEPSREEIEPQRKEIERG